MLKPILIVALLGVSCHGAFADDTCKGRAADKKLSGAALTSTMKKCEKDATSTCEATAATKKYFGAAKTSFVKKCVSDAVGG